MLNVLEFPSSVPPTSGPSQRQLPQSSAKGNDQWARGGRGKFRRWVVVRNFANPTFSSGSPYRCWSSTESISRPHLLKELGRRRHAHKVHSGPRHRCHRAVRPILERVLDCVEVLATSTVWPKGTFRGWPCPRIGPKARRARALRSRDQRSESTALLWSPRLRREPRRSNSIIRSGSPFSNTTRIEAMPLAAYCVWLSLAAIAIPAWLSAAPARISAAT